MIGYGSHEITDEDIASVVAALRSPHLTCGPGVSRFESAFSQAVSANFSVAVNSGTAALHIACIALGVGPDDEVITSPLTFAATSNAVLYCKGKPVFADVLEDGCIDPISVESRISSRTKGIIAIHYAGASCDMKRLRDIADRHGLFLLEDACHALGGQHQDQSPIGSCRYSDAACFSFHPVKHITTGEGGMVTTASRELFERMMILRTHGIVRDPVANLSEGYPEWFQRMLVLGFNYRICDVMAALGESQLKRLPYFISRRKAIALRYNQAFANHAKLKIGTGEDNWQNHAFHLYVLRFGSSQIRNRMYEELRAVGIGSQVHYVPVYLHPYYASLGYTKGLCPAAENYYDGALSIPIFVNLSDSEQDAVISQILRVVDELL